jgi:hypothetical protein
MTTAWQVTPDEAQRLREAVADAVMQTPAGLAARLETDAEASLTLVDSARVAAEEASRLLRESIDGARAAGHSWGAIGELLGVSRQAAQQRFGSPSAVPAETGARRILSPVTAFDEMAALEIEGRQGWHSVGYGTLHHVLEKSEVQWEHRRAVWGAVNRAHLERDGWQVVGSGWFPWSYWARPTDRPALPAE